jgi:rhodanese-related sulfurtransferase
MTATAPRFLAQLFASSLPLLWRAALIAAAGMSAGWVANRFRHPPLALKAYVPPTECSEASESTTSSVLSAKAVSALCGRNDVLFADARDEAQFELGHVTGAVHLACTSSRGDVGELLKQVKNKHTLVVYGNSTDEARRVADGLLRQTKRRDLAVIVLEGGFAAWRDTGLACSSGACENCNESISSATP